MNVIEFPPSMLMTTARQDVVVMSERPVPLIPGSELYLPSLMRVSNDFLFQNDPS